MKDIVMNVTLIKLPNNETFIITDQKSIQILNSNNFVHRINIGIEILVNIYII